MGSWGRQGAAKAQRAGAEGYLRRTSVPTTFKRNGLRIIVPDRFMNQMTDLSSVHLSATSVGSNTRRVIALTMQTTVTNTMQETRQRRIHTRDLPWFVDRSPSNTARQAMHTAIKHSIRKSMLFEESEKPLVLPIDTSTGQLQEDLSTNTKLLA